MCDGTGSARSKMAWPRKNVPESRSKSNLWWRQGRRRERQSHWQTHFPARTRSRPPAKSDVIVVPNAVSVGTRCRFDYCQGIAWRSVPTRQRSEETYRWKRDTGLRKLKGTSKQMQATNYTEGTVCPAERTQLLHVCLWVALLMRKGKEIAKRNWKTLGEAWEKSECISIRKQEEKM